jgi:hypothetical protein
LMEQVETAALRSLTEPNGITVLPCQFQTAKWREFTLV